MDHRLIDYGPEPRPVIAGQDYLPGLADFKQVSDTSPDVMPDPPSQTFAYSRRR